jgi:hypothetical protein
MCVTGADLRAFFGFVLELFAQDEFFEQYGNLEKWDAADDERRIDDEDGEVEVGAISIFALLYFSDKSPIKRTFKFY